MWGDCLRLELRSQTQTPTLLLHPTQGSEQSLMGSLFPEISPEEVASNEESDCRGADRTPGKVTVEDFLGGEGDKEETSRNTQGRGQALS